MVYFIDFMIIYSDLEVIMANRKIVVALGRNAFGETFPEQKENVSKAAGAIADLVEMKYDVVITHSNGPESLRFLIQISI